MECFDLFVCYSCSLGNPVKVGIGGGERNERVDRSERSDDLPNSGNLP